MKSLTHSFSKALLYSSVLLTTASVPLTSVVHANETTTPKVEVTLDAQQFLKDLRNQANTNSEFRANIVVVDELGRPIKTYDEEKSLQFLKKEWTDEALINEVAPHHQRYTIHATSSTRPSINGSIEKSSTNITITVLDYNGPINVETPQSTIKENYSVKFIDIDTGNEIKPALSDKEAEDFVKKGLSLSEILTKYGEGYNAVEVDYNLLMSKADPNHEATKGLTGIRTYSLTYNFSKNEKVEKILVGPKYDLEAIVEFIDGETKEVIAPSLKDAEAFKFIDDRNGEFDTTKILEQYGEPKGYNTVLAVKNTEVDQKRAVHIQRITYMFGKTTVDLNPDLNPLVKPNTPSNQPATTTEPSPNTTPTTETPISEDKDKTSTNSDKKEDVTTPSSSDKQTEDTTKEKEPFKPLDVPKNDKPKDEVSSVIKDKTLSSLISNGSNNTSTTPSSTTSGSGSNTSSTTNTTISSTNSTDEKTNLSSTTTETSNSTNTSADNKTTKNSTSASTKESSTPPKTTVKTLPRTGDSSTKLTSLAGVSIIGLVLGIIGYKKLKKESN